MNISEQLNIELQHLERWSVYLSAPNKDDLQVLRKSAEISGEIVRTIGLVAEKPYNKELIEFLGKINLIMDRLHKTAKQMDSEPISNDMLSTAIEAFSSYVDQITPKQSIKKIRKIAAYIPYINSVVDCCETMAKYWNSATQNEKIALALATTLLLTSVVLTITFYASPVLAALPLIGLATVGLSAMAKACYEQALINPRNKKQKSTAIKSIVNALDKQKKSVSELLAVKDSQFITSVTSNIKMKKD